MENDPWFNHFLSENDHLHILPEKTAFFYVSTPENAGNLGYRDVIGRPGKKASDLIGWLDVWLRETVMNDVDNGTADYAHSGTADA